MRIAEKLTCMLGNKSKCVTVQPEAGDSDRVSFKKGKLPGELVLSG